MWIRPRKVVAQWLGQDSSDQETSAAPVSPPLQCDVCGSEGHVRDACPSAIGPEDVGRTWRSGGYPDGPSGTGDTFDAVRDFWRRFRGEA